MSQTSEKYWRSRCRTLRIRPLTPTETTVACLLANGYIGPKLASFLKLTYNTIGLHKQRIYVKLGLNNQYELAAWYRAHRRNVEGAA